MINLRLDSRGGQGVVMASRMLASAFFMEGYIVQASPSFGAERRGAPVKAFLRVDKETIWERCNIADFDHLMIFDDSLLGVEDITHSLKRAHPGTCLAIH